MKIDLLKIYEDNKKIDKLKDEIQFKEELNRLLSDIVMNKEKFYTDNEYMLKKLSLKYSKNKQKEKNTFYCISFSGNEYYAKYTINLTKENIKKIQDYVNKEEK